MNQNEITKKVIEILERHDPLPKDTLEEKLTYRYLDAGHIDSFAIMNLIIELETAFNITLSQEDTQSDEFRAVGGLVSIVMKQVAP